MKNITRLIRAWCSGSYRIVPWRTIAIMMLVALYAINPFDFIPDYIPIIGVVDDAAMLGFLWRSLRKDAELFMESEMAEEHEWH